MKTGKYQNESNTRAPEVVEELEHAADLEKGYWLGIQHGLKAQVEKIFQHNRDKGFNPHVMFRVLYKDGLWHLELEDGSGRKVTFAHANLALALEEIFR